MKKMKILFRFSLVLSLSLSLSLSLVSIKARVLIVLYCLCFLLKNFFVCCLLGRRALSPRKAKGGRNIVHRSSSLRNAPKNLTFLPHDVALAVQELLQVQPSAHLHPPSPVQQFSPPAQHFLEQALPMMFLEFFFDFSPGEREDKQKKRIIATASLRPYQDSQAHLSPHELQQHLQSLSFSAPHSHFGVHPLLVFFG